MLHTWLLVLSHPGERWARRNLAGMLCRQGLLTPMWEPHMPPCISANSSSPSSYGMHFNFTSFGLLLYRASSTNWYMLDRWATLSASTCSSGSSPVWRRRTVRCAHAGAWGSTARTKGSSSAIGAASPMAGAWGPAGGCCASASLGHPATSLPAASGSSAGKYLPGPAFLRLFCPADGSTDG